MDMTVKYVYEMTEDERNDLLGCLTYLAGGSDRYAEEAPQHSIVRKNASILRDMMLDAEGN